VVLIVRQSCGCYRDTAHQDATKWWFCCLPPANSDELSQFQGRAVGLRTP
jgi:hypothetical protein